MTMLDEKILLENYVMPSITRRPKFKKLMIGVAIIAIIVGAVIGTMAYLDARSSYGDSAKSVADKLGCSNYHQVTGKKMSYYDQGTCSFLGTTIKVTTFTDESQRNSFSTLTDTLVPMFTKHGGAYVVGNGWNIADNVRLDEGIAQMISIKMGGDIHKFSAN